MISVSYDAHMGDDVFVVNKARVSFARRTATLRPRDARLLRYLARHGHWTPFAHAQVSVTVRAPVFVARQCFRHKVGFVESEVSRRYVDSAPEFYQPEVWRARAADKKQGSGEAIVHEATAAAAHTAFAAALMACLDVYEELLIDRLVAPEQARMVLPQAMLTEWAWTGSLAAWARFCRQRLGADAQAETGEVARAAAAIIAPLFPASWAALMSEGRDA